MGKVLYWVGLVGFAALVALDMLCNPKIAAEILKQDAAVTGGIRPNKKALIRILLPTLFLVLMMLGIVIADGVYHVLLIVFLGAGFMGAFLGADMTTRLTLDGDQLTIRRTGNVHRYHLSQVRSVAWKPCRGILGKMLVLVMEDGKSYWFNLDMFVGVQDMHTRLSRYLEQQEHRA